MADDEARPVDAKRDRALLANHRFRIVLGAEIRMVEVFRLLEHVLAEDAVVQAGRGDRAHVVEAASADRPGEFHRVARAFDVGGLLAFRRRLEVVDRREVEDVRDLPLELPLVGGAHAELRPGEIALHRHHELRRLTPGGAQRVELALRLLADEHVDGLAAGDEPLDEEPPDETGCAGDEVSHRSLLLALYRESGARRLYAVMHRPAAPFARLRLAVL